MRKGWKQTAAAALAVVMAASLLGGCGQKSGTESEKVEKYTADGELVKPEKITVMTDGTVFTKRNGRDALEKRWEELTGIDLEFIQPDHSAYYDVVGQTFASGEKNWPDVILLSSTYYSGYAEEGALWDMTDTFENSDLKKSGRITVLILNLAKVMNLFESVFVLQNDAVIQKADVLQTYIYTQTFNSGALPDFGYTTAVSVTASVVGCILVLLCNRASYKVRGRGIV